MTVVKARVDADLRALSVDKHQMRISAWQLFRRPDHLCCCRCLGWRNCDALFHKHPLQFTLRQRATGRQPHHPHDDNDIRIPRGLGESKINLPKIGHGLSLGLQHAAPVI